MVWGKSLRGCGCLSDVSLFFADLAECKLVSFPIGIYKVLRNVSDQIQLITLANNELKSLTSKFMTTFCQLRGRPSQLALILQALTLSGGCLQGQTPISWTQQIIPGEALWMDCLPHSLEISAHHSCFFLPVSVTG